MLAIILVKGYTVVTEWVWGDEGNSDPQAILGIRRDGDLPFQEGKSPTPDVQVPTFGQ